MIDESDTHRRQPTLFIKVDDGAIPLAPRAQVDGSSLGDVWLAGVGLGSPDQHAHTGREKTQNAVQIKQQLADLPNCHLMRYIMNYFTHRNLRLLQHIAFVSGVNYKVA